MLEENINFEVKNKKLKEMLEQRANELHISLNQLIWNYINRGLMGDNMNERKFNELHSIEFLKKVNDALDVD